MKRHVYLDHAATTYVDPRVMEAMEPYFTGIFGNPGSFHHVGLIAKRAVDSARDKVAEILQTGPGDKVVFTGGGTESINLAIKGVAFNKTNLQKGKHIITQKTEHHAVLHSCEWLEKQGYEVTYLNVDRYGMVAPEDVEKAIGKDTILVTIMYANNEIGTVQPVAEIGKLCKEKGVYFHTDACQAAGALDINVNNLNVDLMTMNGSKIYGPKGIGILYVKRGVKIDPLIHGGTQEENLRAGTENVPNIVGFAKALEIAQEEREEEGERLIRLRNKLISGVQERIRKTRLNGHPVLRLPNNANITVMDIEGEALTVMMSEEGIYTSTGSACTSTTLDPSHVILATGVPYEVAHGSLRFTLGRHTTEEDIDYVLEKLPPIVEYLRGVSPVNVSEELVSEVRA